jgi:DeoR family fructose operon transcriptional repressor
MENCKSEKLIRLPAERQKQIVEFIHKNGSAQIKLLADYQNVSEATIRRDLDELAALGLIERTHGGAMAIDSSTSFEHKHGEKMKIMLKEKRNIAKAACSQIKDGDTIFLDSGTTTYFIAQNLDNFKNLTVITHDLQIANTAVLHPTSTLIVTGGIRREEFSVLVGSLTENFIRELKVNKVFLGADAVDVESGIFNANFIEVGIKKLLLAIAKHIILVTDTSKFSRTALARVCGIDSIGTIITDNNLSKEIKDRIEKNGVRLILV